MQVGLGLLRLAPRDFWASTPREIAAAVATDTATAMSRDDFNRLAERFPDIP